MELRHLRYFVAVAEELNFTRAGALLHVAQSAVSSQIRDLEEEIGLALLERNSRQVALTSAGKSFYGHADRILREVEEVIRQTRRVGKAGSGTLAIGFIGSQSHEWMPQVLKRFRQRYPGVEVTLTELVPAQQLEALLVHTLDVGFIGPIDGKAPPGLRMECIAEERPMVGVPSDHPLASEPFLDLHRLKRESFVFTSRKNAPSYRAWVARLCERAGFTPRVVQEVDRARTGVQYVAAGFGISIFAEHISKLPAPGVVFIPVRPAGPKVRYGVAWRRGLVSEVVRRFIQYTKEQFRLTPDGE